MTSEEAEFSSEPALPGDNVTPVDVPEAPPETRAMLEARWPNDPERVEIAAQRLRQFIELLLEWNQRFNLTGDRDPAVQWRAHVNDALQVAALIEAKAGRPRSRDLIMDLGTGGGVPGLIWALLWDEPQILLVEATGKKARFLTMAADELGLGGGRVLILNVRAEELARDPAVLESCAWISARAVGPLAKALNWAMPFVREKGWLFAIKGAEVDDEIAAARDVSARTGARFPPDRIPYVRSDGKPCTLIACEKVHHPRKGGAGAGRRRAQAPHAKRRRRGGPDGGARDK